MMAYIWPLALVVLSNTVYQICAKSMPDRLNPMAALTVTYAVGAVVSAVLFYVQNRGQSLLEAYGNLNWAPFALGVVIVGLEVGIIYAYKAGWQVNTLSVVQSAFLAIALLGVGKLLFGETLTFSKILGAAICMVGLYFLNR